MGTGRRALGDAHAGFANAVAAQPHRRASGTIGAITSSDARSATFSAAGIGFTLRCEACGNPVEPRPYASLCPRCGGTIGFSYRAAQSRGTADLTDLRETLRSAREMWDYAPLLPVERPEAAVTLAEGGTPLLRASERWGCRLWLKDETRNPTGSHKDRALSVAVTRGRELGFQSCVVISAGSTGLSTAAYAARAGMRCAVVVPAGTPDQRIAPLALYGATVLEAPGSFEVALRLVEELAKTRPLYVTSTYRRGNPYQAEGAKTIGYEIAMQLGRVPDWIVVPTGGGGTAAALWRAFGELEALGLLPAEGGAGRDGARLPRIVTVQPSAYNALEIAMRDGLTSEEALYALGISEEVPTVQAKLQHGVPPDALYALEALRESGGTAVSVTDEEALAAQAQLASEGVFGEPSAAAALAGVQRLVTSGAVRADETVVALVTGSGFREPSAPPVRRAPLTEASLAEALG